MKRHPLFLLAVIGLLALNLVGCSGASGTKVTGTVYLDDKPLADARVLFEGRPDIKGGATASSGGYGTKTDANGNFVLGPDPHTGKSIPPGNYVVFISKVVDKKGRVVDPEELAQLEAAGQVTHLVPARYRDEQDPVLTAIIKETDTALPPFKLAKR